MSQILSLGINNQPQTLSLSSIDINSVDINQPLSKSSLVGLSFNDLVDIYDKTISRYQTLYQQFLNNYNQNDAKCGIKGKDGNSYGGGWQNSVYKNDGSYLGTYPDGNTRAMSNLAGNRDNSNVNTFSKCLNYVNQRGYKYFGLQYFDSNRQVAECWTTNDDSPTTGYARYANSSNTCSLQTYTKTLETIEKNLDLINSEITLYIVGQDPNFFQNLSEAHKNSLLINSQYDRLRNMRKEIVQDTFKYEPPLETSSNFVKQSNHLYILIFILLFLIIYIFTYNYYTPLKSTSAQTGGAREKNYLLLFVLFATLAIILKFLS